MGIFTYSPPTFNPMTFQAYFSNIATLQFSEPPAPEPREPSSWAKVAEIIGQMRDYLDEHGWVQGTIRNAATGGVCLQGAYMYSQYTRNRTSQEYDDVAGVLGRVAAQFHEGLRLLPIAGWNAVITFNDSPGTSLHDVRNLLDRAHEIALQNAGPEKKAETVADEGADARLAYAISAFLDWPTPELVSA